MSNSVTQLCFRETEAAVAAWKLGLVTVSDLCLLANTALAHGAKSQVLSEMAERSNPDEYEGRELMNRLVKELRLDNFDPRSAALRYTSCVSQLILSGEVSPSEGAAALWRASLAVGDASFHELDPFIYASSEYDDRPEDRVLFDKAILQEAERWAKR